MSYLNGNGPLANAPLNATMGQCGCCTRLDGDFTLKPVQYCRLCKEFLCVPCSKSPWRRARAAALKAVGR